MPYMHRLGIEHFFSCAKKCSVPVFRVFLVPVVLVLLGGCGFTLRGSTDLSAALQTLQVESTEENSERALSVNANARAGEYEITMVVPFQLRRGTELVLGPETLSVAQAYLADPENAVAKNEEAALIRSEMRRELAQQLLRRLQALQL